MHKSAIRFEREDRSRTYLILRDFSAPEVFDPDRFFLGYFSLSTKEIRFGVGALGRSARDKIKAKQIKDESTYTVNCFLIGQIGKNKAVLDNPLDLNTILSECYRYIKEASKIVAGRVVMLECKNNKKLISLYVKHGFSTIDVIKNPSDPEYVTMYRVVDFSD